jgi:hypothetical protein
MLTFKMSGFEEAVRRIKGARDELPYALSRTLNEAAFRTRQHLINTTWPSSVQARNTGFMRGALRVQRSSKTDLRVGIYDALGRGNLLQHSQGGEKRPIKGGRLAIPNPRWVRYKSEGVDKPQLPRVITSTTSKRKLRITSQGIFVGEHGRLQLRYSFKDRAIIKKDVPFQEECNKQMLKNVNELCPHFLSEAMRTAK